MQLQALKDFVKFIRQQGIVGLAVGFILGGAVSKTVTSLVQDIVQPLLGYVLGSSSGLRTMRLGSVMFGNFIANLIDLLVVAAVVFFIFRAMKLEKLDAPKQ